MRQKLTVYTFLIAALGILTSSLLGIWILHTRVGEDALASLNSSLALLDCNQSHTDPQVLIDHYQAATQPDSFLAFLQEDGTLLLDSNGLTQGDYSHLSEVPQATTYGVAQALRADGTSGQLNAIVVRQFHNGMVAYATMPVPGFFQLLLENGLGTLSIILVTLGLCLWFSLQLARETTRPLENREQELDQADQRMQDVRSEFAANVSHELKTPLTSIKGFTDMLSSGMVKGKQDQQRFITMIGVEVDRLMELINDVLKLSELESVAMIHSDDAADGESVAQDVIQKLLPVAEASGVTLRYRGLGAKVAISTSRLWEILNNLVENAIKYNLPGGKVELSMAQSANIVSIQVRDTGIGIPEEAQSRVFERFYRVDKGRARTAGGTGLGLAIVKHIVQLYGGKLHLESMLGVGTTITITLPGVI